MARVCIFSKGRCIVKRVDPMGMLVLLCGVANNFSGKRKKITMLQNLTMMHNNVIYNFLQVKKVTGLSIDKLDHFASP